MKYEPGIGEIRGWSLSKRMNKFDIAFHLECWLGREVISNNEQSDLQQMFPLAFLYVISISLP